MPVGTRSAFQLDQFKKSVLSGAGLARTNRFEVMITAPSGLAGQGSSAGIVSLYAEQASLPPINVTIRPYKIFGPTHQKPTSIEYGGEGIPVTFHVDRDMKIKNFFEDWCHMVVNPNSFEVSYQKDYISTVIIRQNNEQENTTYEVELLEAFPRSMNLMELNHASSNQTHRLTVIFAYRYWKSKVYGGSKVDTQATPQLRSQQNPQVPKPSFEEAPIPRDFGGFNPGGELAPGIGGGLPVAA